MSAAAQRQWETYKEVALHGDHIMAQKCGFGITKDKFLTGWKLTLFHYKQHSEISHAKKKVID